jgi:hypothetical protein
MEIGDAFYDGKSFIFVITADHYRLKTCNVFYAQTGRLVGHTVEQVGTLSNMRKLTPLEKELL